MSPEDGDECLWNTGSTLVKQVWKDESNTGQPERSTSRTGLGTECCPNKCELKWLPSPPAPTCSVRSQATQSTPKARAYLLSFLRKIPNTSTILSRESRPQTKESIPSGGGRAILESPVNPSEGWASGQGLHPEPT